MVAAGVMIRTLGEINPLKRTRVSRLVASIVGSLLLISADTFAATPVLDQSQLIVGADLVGVAPSDNWQQDVVAGVNGKLSSVSLYSYFTGTGGTFTFYINLGRAFEFDPNNFEVVVTGDRYGWFNIDVSAANIQVTNGTHFVIGALGEAYLYGASGNVYTRGNWWNYDIFGYHGFGFDDLSFATYVEPVPEPSMTALFVIALAMFGALRWSSLAALRRAKTAAPRTS
jgi:hypothetical protein